MHREGHWVVALIAYAPLGVAALVADEVGCKHRTANAKLHELEEQDRVTSKKVGNAYLWQTAEGE